MDISDLDLRTLGTILGALVLAGLAGSVLVGAWVVARVRRLQVPPDADFMTALQMTPFSVVLLLDLLDFSLDLFGAPVAWGFLSYLGLQPLRKVTVVESLIPGTQILPTMTIAWLVARWVGRRS